MDLKLYDLFLPKTRRITMKTTVSEIINEVIPDAIIVKLSKQN